MPNEPQDSRDWLPAMTPEAAPRHLDDLMHEPTFADLALALRAYVKQQDDLHWNVVLDAFRARDEQHRREAEAAAGTALDVERLARALARYRRSGQTSCTVLHVDKYGNPMPCPDGPLNEAKGIAAEYARLAGVDSDRQPVADASEDDA